jgi:hypothetical protein
MKKSKHKQKTDLTIDKTIAIAILARDCEKSLANNIAKIERVRKYFKESLVIVIENDSIDQTKNILRDWEINAENVVVISEDTHTKTIPDKNEKNPFPGASKYRIEKMCFYRNKYMDYLASIDIEYDYLMIFDIDVDDFNEQGIISAIVNAPSDWTALFANGVRYLNFLKNIQIGYYDGYPLILYHENTDKIILHKNFKEISEDITKITKQLKRKKYIKCVSAFGGIGIYKYQYIKNNRYYIISNNRSCIFEVLCEHISLNYALYKESNDTSYITNEMIVFYEKINSVKLFLFQILPFRLKVFLYEFIKRKKYPI